MAEARFKSGHEERFLDNGICSVVLAGEEKPGPRRFDMLAYTGVDIGRYWGRMVVDMAGLERDDKMPMLLEHDDRTPVAVCDSHSVDEDGLHLSGYFLSADASPEAGLIVKRAKEGLPYKASIGIRFLEVGELTEGSEAEINGRTFKGPMTIVRRARLFETSFIHCNPADLATSAEVLRAQQEVRQMADTNVPAGALVEISDELKQKLRDEGAKADREARAKYRAEIRAALSGAANKSIRIKVLKEGLSLDEAKTLALAASLAREAKLEAEKKADAEAVAKISSQANFRGLGHAGAKAEDGGVDAQIKMLPLVDRAKAEIASDTRLGQLFGDATEKVYATALGYESRLRSSGKPLMSPEGVEIFAAYLRENCDPRHGPVNFDQMVEGQGYARLANAGKAASDYSKITVKGFIGSFYSGYETEEVWASKLLFPIEATQETEVIRWLGQFPQMQPWLGARQEKNMPVYQILVTSALYEATVAFDKNDYRLQKFGFLTQRMGQAGAVAQRHWNLLLTKAIENNATAYDSVAFFATTHTLGGDSGTMSNLLLSSAGYPSLAVADPANVTQMEAAKILLQITPHFRAFKAANGEPINEDAKRFLVMVPLQHEGAFLGAVGSDRLDNGADNPLRSSRHSFEIFGNPRLTSTNPYGYIFRIDTPNMPFIKAEPGPPELLFQGPGSQLEFEKHKYGFGVESTRAVGLGAWESAMRFTIGAA